MLTSGEETRLIMYGAVPCILTKVANIDHGQLLKLTVLTQNGIKMYKSLGTVANVLSRIENRGLLELDSAHDDGWQRACEPGMILSMCFGPEW